MSVQSIQPVTELGKPAVGQATEATEAVLIIGSILSVILWGFAVYGVYSLLKRRKRA